MRALFYLLTLTFCCLLKNGFCGQFEDFKSNTVVKRLLQQYFNEDITREQLLEAVNDIEGLEMHLNINTLKKYLHLIKKAGGGSRQPAITFNQFINNEFAMSLVRKYKDEQNKEIRTQQDLLKELNKIEELKTLSKSALTKYLVKAFGATAHLPTQSKSTELWDFSNPVPPFSQAPQIARQSSNFTSGNPGSSRSAVNKGKSTKFSKKNSGNSSITGSAPHYGGAMPSQQAPPMDDTFVPSEAGTDSMNWLGENLQSNDSDLDLVVNPKNPNLFKRAWGFVSSLGGATQQEPQFSPSIHDTAAASSYYPSNQPDDQTLESMITPRNQKGFMPSWFGASQQEPQFSPSIHDTAAASSYYPSNQNYGDLDSMIRKPSSAEGFYGTPYFPNQSQSTGWPGASNIFSPTPNTSNFTSGNPGSSTYYGSAIPSQQAPMPGTSFPASQNYPFNQSSQLNSSTNFGPFQTETHSWDWSGGNSHNNTGTLDSVVNKRKPSSSKDKNATKTGKKPRK